MWPSQLSNFFFKVLSKRVTYRSEKVPGFGSLPLQTNPFVTSARGEVAGWFLHMIM